MASTALIKAECDKCRNASKSQNVSKTMNIIKVVLEGQLEFVSPECTSKQEITDNSYEH
jgi:hypothetical protein